jgi:hypothetical protein
MRARRRTDPRVFHTPIAHNRAYAYALHTERSRTAHRTTAGENAASARVPVAPRQT